MTRVTSSKSKLELNPDVCSFVPLFLNLTWDFVGYTAIALPTACSEHVLKIWWEAKTEGPLAKLKKRVCVCVYATTIQTATKSHTASALTLANGLHMSPLTSKWTKTHHIMQDASLPLFNETVSVQC